ncbi:CRASP family complement regulator-acquiring lipoprotein [Borreliella afzelii]|uniref:Blasticidin-S acetyltransferase n=1 Tax=Borreliella afzelii TaxID=29518 RepID=A0A1L4DGJ3_BORAF|nr:blasticidin-S acetyltransferase [Borreliella afzelii]
MKNNIILCMCVFLLLNSCGADHATETAIKKHIDKTENANISETKNLIEIIKTTIDKNKLPPIEPEESQETVDSESDGEVFTIDKRAFDFINTFLTNDELDEFTTIFHKPKLQSPGQILNNIAILELNLERIINHLSLETDALDKVKISDLKKIGNSLEQFFSIRTIVSTEIKQILLDYRENKNSIKTDDSKLETYLSEKLNRFNEKKKENDNLKTTILSISISGIVD